MKKTKILATSFLIAGFVAVIGINTAVAGEWYDSVKVGADLRYRYESIVQEKDHVVGTDVETYDTSRDRQRIRFRLKVEGKVNDNWEIKTQLATGNQGIDSTNETLDGAYANKAFDLDEAYAEGKLFGVEEPIVTAFLGKMSNPLVNPGKDQLLWDGDVTPEGIAARFEMPAGDMKVFANAAGFWLDEVSSSIDTMSYSIQAGVETKLSDIDLTVGGGLNAITNAYQTYGINMNVGEAFVELSTKLGGEKLAVFAHYAQNGGAADDEATANGATEAEKVDTSAMAFGVKYGKAKNEGSYEVSAMYKKYGNGFEWKYSDSDFANAEMDSSGIVLAAAYAPWEKTTIGATYFINTYEDTNEGDYSPLNYNRLQLDLSLKY